MVRKFSDYDLDAKAAAYILRLNREHLMRQARTKKIPGIKVGRYWWFNEDELLIHARDGMMYREEKRTNDTGDDSAYDFLQ